ncbi:MAG TPA: hypothetical protein VJL29_03460 [Thermoguttaceae bacterium]|nr:hypothetical protein [Thermoguttaceae bacterium]
MRSSYAMSCAIAQSFFCAFALLMGSTTLAANPSYGSKGGDSSNSSGVKGGAPQIADPDILRHLTSLTAKLSESKGIYALQASLRFDNLQTVIYDPQNKSLTLLGNRRTSRWLVPIPYLDHLATALESDHPEFTLPWTPEAKQQADALMRQAADVNTVLWDRIVANARHRLFDQRGLLTIEGLRILRALPFPSEGLLAGITNKYDVMAKTFQICGGEQQATLIGSYGRSLRDPFQLDGAIHEVSMDTALAASMTAPESAELWEIFLTRFADVFDLGPQGPLGVFRRARQRGDSIVAARNAAIENVLAAVEPTWNRVFTNGLELHAANKPYMHLPPDLVRSLAGITIPVTPTWRGVRPESCLGRVMFESDILLKWVVSDPSLMGVNLPSHLTEYEWQKKNGQDTSRATKNDTRFWISPDAVELAQSADGNVLEIRKVAMRVNTDDPASKAYVNDLTVIYDQLADEFPTLHELSECAKIMAVAQWLKQKDPAFRLPAEGRATWEPPTSVQGFITMNASVQINRTDDASSTRVSAKWKGQAALEGGVSLVLGQNAVHWDSGSTDVVSLDNVRKVITPTIYDNQALRAISRVKTIPPPPMPPGATARAEIGNRKLEYIQVLRDRLGDQANAEVTQEALREATRLAKKLQQSDKLINDLQAGRIKALEAFGAAEQWAKETRKEYCQDLANTLTGGFSEFLADNEVLEFRTNMAELLDAKHRSAQQWFLLTNRYGPKVATLLGDIDTMRESIGSDDHYDRNMATFQRSLDLMSQISEAFPEIPGGRVLGNAPTGVSLAADTLKASYTIAEIHYNIKEVEILSEQMGNEAQFLKTLQTRRETDFKQLQSVLTRLEQDNSK